MWDAFFSVQWSDEVLLPKAFRPVSRHGILCFLPPITLMYSRCPQISRIEEFGEIIRHFVFHSIPRLSSWFCFKTSRIHFQILLSKTLTTRPAQCNFSTDMHVNINVFTQSLYHTINLYWYIYSPKEFSLKGIYHFVTLWETFIFHSHTKKKKSDECCK